MTITDEGPLVAELGPIDGDMASRGRSSNVEALVRARTRPQSVVTAPGSRNKIDKVFEQYAQLGYRLQFEVLDHIELIARYNPDMSQAIENTRTLSNSGHELYVDGKSDLQKKRAKEYLEEQSKSINKSSGGIDGLIDKLLWQGATFGAMCGEWILSDDLTEVVDFVDLNPKWIKFWWDDDEMYSGWAPYQEVKPEQAKEAEGKGQKVRLKRFVRLDPLTFHYFAFDSPPNNPYGTPPFLSALRNIAIQEDMMDNMSQIVKKMGLLGIVDMSIEPLTQTRGESNEDFSARAGLFLTQYAQACEDMITEGGLVHFSDAEVKTQSITGNAAGATNIFKQNEEQVFSGLKSMPSVQGRSYSTTETYAGVAYDIIIRNTWRYQRAVKRMIETGYWLMLNLKGMPATKVSLEFKPNKTLHRLQNAQALLLEIKSALQLWATGVLDQEGFAQYIGFSSIKKVYGEIPESQIIGNASPGGGAGNTSVTQPDTGPKPPDSNAIVSAILEAGADTLFEMDDEALREFVFDLFE